ncbi:hypothetical protein GPECTOR_820g49 [Gonium pectorale]|uniref:Uncharacterized protein n=1 Tax=Gonium pectorale TaxID=33097 RepID=A0A150FVN5_GONPE|nr:hypothetical protein GPECTOR_820g49 [Gonium pectorale]|eukprot:KXZ41090.1 hypothetical protein GPECTOR_820g49 [Gonium pectorale]
MSQSSVAEEAEAHVESYGSFLKACSGKLLSVWKQVGKSQDECRSTILLTASQALAVWEAAVEKAVAERESIKALIQQHSSEIANIKSQLDDGAQTAEPEPSMREGEGTLLRKLEALKGTLELWRAKRASRLQVYEGLMEVHTSLKRQLGIRHTPADDMDITTGALEYLQMENDKLQEDKNRRLARAEQELDTLRAICRELGEDGAAAAAEVHPALSSLSAEKESAEVLGSIYKLTGGAGLGGPTGGQDLDLSEATFDKLAAKIRQMEQLKHEREAQSRDLLSMLGGLWDALNIPEDAPERGMVQKMLSADRPQRLHRRTLEKCLAEIKRLEGCKALAMRELALSKARELEQLCISTRISPPLTGPLLAELDKPGQGRDASRNLQRATKASKLRERLGPMLKELLAALEKWELEEGEPFLYDEQVLQETHLKAVEAELEHIALEKQPRVKASSTAGTAGAAASAAPSTASKPPNPGAAGTAKPTSSQSAPRPSSAAGGHGTTGISRPALSASTERPLFTPRRPGDNPGASNAAASRRLSLAAPMPPPPASARDGTVFRGSAGSVKAMSRMMMMRSTDFGSAGGNSLRSSAAVAEAREAGKARSAAAAAAAAVAAATPPPVATPARSTTAVVVTPGAVGPSPCGSSIKNSAQDLFRRYLGDTCTDSARETPTKTPGSVADSPVANVKLSLSSVDDENGDDVHLAKCDTPKSTATSRVLQPSNAVTERPVGGSLVGPGAKPTRIPRIRA